MKILIILFLFICNISWASCGKSTKDGENFCNVKLSYKYKKTSKKEYFDIYDGDTFYVDLPQVKDIFGKRLGIRLAVADTPEMNARSAYERFFAKKAKEFTRDALSNAKRVDLKNCKRGSFFRIICQVLYDGNDLASELLKNGLAVKYKK